MSDFEKTKSRCELTEKIFHTAYARQFQDMNKLNARLKIEQDDLKVAQATNDAARIKSRSGQVEALTKILRAKESVYRAHMDRIKVLRDTMSWCDQTQKEFERLGKGLRIDFAIYTVINGQNIVLVRTTPPEPNEDQTKSAVKN